MRLKAFAKINLGLRVLGRRFDGYHEIDTVFARLGISDSIELRLRDDDKIFVKTEGMDLDMQKNLVWQSAWLLQKFMPRRRGVDIFLKKNIPACAGLGGGSSDAGAVLRGLNKLWALNFSSERLLRLSVSLGSDVPFFLTTGVQRGGGRGEVLSPAVLPEDFPREVLLVVPDLEISTAWAYSELKNFSGSRAKNLVLKNDFEKVVFRNFPQLKKIKSLLKKSGAVIASLSGTGSAMYGLFESREDVKNIAKKFEPYGRVFITKIRV